MDDPPSSIYTTFGRLIYTATLHKIRRAVLIFPNLCDAEQRLLLTLLKSDVIYLQWIIGSSQRIAVVHALENRGLHLRKRLEVYNGGFPTELTNSAGGITADRSTSVPQPSFPNQTARLPVLREEDEYTEGGTYQAAQTPSSTSV